MKSYNEFINEGYEDKNPEIDWDKFRDLFGDLSDYGVYTYYSNILNIGVKFDSYGDGKILKVIMYKIRPDEMLSIYTDNYETHPALKRNRNEILNDDRQTFTYLKLYDLLGEYKTNTFNVDEFKNWLDNI
jgi:hypothetical protein